MTVFTCWVDGSEAGAERTPPAGGPPALGRAGACSSAATHTSPVALEEASVRERIRVPVVWWGPGRARPLPFSAGGLARTQACELLALLGPRLCRCARGTLRVVARLLIIGGGRR